MRKEWLPFVGPFACIGAVGGWLTLVKLDGSSAPDAASIALLLMTPITASLFGALLARGRRRWVAAALGFPFLVVGAGAFNGGCIGLALMMGSQHEPVVLFGLLFGAMCGVAFIPPMLWAFLTAVRVGSARPGSLLDAMHRRAPWGAAAASASIAVWAVHRTPGELPQHVSAVAVSVAGIGVATLVAVLVADVVALVGASRLARLATTPVDAPVESPQGREVLDLGVGDELLAEQWTGAASAYRPERIHVTRLRGSVTLARRQILRIVAGDAFATCAVVACVVRLAA